MGNIVCLEYGMWYESDLQELDLKDEIEQVMESLEVKNSCPKESVKGFQFSEGRWASLVVHW